MSERRVHYEENCGVCQLQEIVEDNSVRCSIDNKKYNKDYKCHLFKHILDD